MGKRARVTYTPSAKAQCESSYRGGYGHSYGGSSHSYGGYGYRAPVYHAPSVHLTGRVCRADRLRCMPGRGLHTDGHYDTLPNYTPRHFDTLHNGHIDTNRRFHH